MYSFFRIGFVLLLVNSLVRLLQHLNRRDYSLAGRQLATIILLICARLIVGRVWEAMP